MADRELKLKLVWENLSDCTKLQLMERCESLSMRASILKLKSVELDAQLAKESADGKSINAILPTEINAINSSDGVAGEAIEGAKTELLKFYSNNSKGIEKGE